MSSKKAFIDYQARAAEFAVGDTVLLPVFTRGNRYAPHIGIVTAVLDKIGFIDVETPYGNIRFSAEELVPDNRIDVPPTYLQDTSYSSWELERARRIADRYARNRLASVAIKATELRKEGMSEMKTYDVLSQANAEVYGDHEVKQGVRFAFEAEPMTKTAIYWRAKGRRYMPSKKEVECGVFACPSCRADLHKTHYKKHTKLYVCKECLFTIRPKDLLTPGQEIVEVEDALTEKSPVDFFSANDPLLRAIVGDKSK